MCHPELKWQQNGLIIGCCKNHQNTAVEFGECKYHGKNKFSPKAESFAVLAIHSSKKCLVNAVFHDHAWYNINLSAHLSSRDIFTSIPLNMPLFLQNHIVPCYDMNEHEIPSSYHDLTFLFPTNCTELYLYNWNLRDSINNVYFIRKNWHKCKDRVSSLIAYNLKATQIAVKETKKVQAKLDKTQKVCYT